MPPQGQSSKAAGGFSSIQVVWILKEHRDILYSTARTQKHRKDSGKWTFLIVFYAVLLITVAWFLVEIRQTSRHLSSSMLLLALQ